MVYTWSLYIIPQNQMTALMLAAVYGQLEVVELLIGAGAKLDIVDLVSCTVELQDHSSYVCVRVHVTSEIGFGELCLSIIE